MTPKEIIRKKRIESFKNKLKENSKIDQEKLNQMRKTWKLNQK